MRIKKKILKTPEEKTLSLMIGIPGVGKNVFADKMMEIDKKNRILISSDNIRFHLTDYDETQIQHDSSIESMVWSTIKKGVKEALHDPTIKECILDATNIRSSGRKRFIQMAQEIGVKTRGIIFYASLKRIKKQNQQRKRLVPEPIIDSFYKRFQHPRKDEFNELYYVGSKKKFEKQRKKQNLESRKLKITGTDIMNILGIPQGKKVGEILRYLENKVIDGKIKNKQKTLQQEIIIKFQSEKNKNMT